MSLTRVLLLLSIVSFTSCSKERLLQMENPAFAAKIPENLQRAPQVVTLNSKNDLPFITAAGNSIDFSIDGFYRTKNFSPVDFPVRLEITELLSVKDIILHQKPTVSNGKLLTTDGQIKVQAFKDQDELQVFQGALQINMNGIFPGQGDPDMLLFLGKETEGRFNWQVDSSTCSVEKGRLYCQNISTTGTSGWDYVLFPYQLGWINIDKFADYSPTTSLSFVSDVDLKYVCKFLYFPDIQSIMQVYKEKAEVIPVGVKAFVIAFTFSEDETPYLHFEEITVRENQTINLRFNPTTREALEKKLESL